MSDLPDRYATWEDALVGAILAAKDIPPEHGISDIHFGKFSDSVGGGYYFDFRVHYKIGNTKDVPFSVDEAQRLRRIVLACRSSMERSQAD